MRQAAMGSLHVQANREAGVQMVVARQHGEADQGMPALLFGGGNHGKTADGETPPVQQQPGG